MYLWVWHFIKNEKKNIYNKINNNHLVTFFLGAPGLVDKNLSIYSTASFSFNVIPFLART